MKNGPFEQRGLGERAGKKKREGEREKGRWWDFDHGLSLNFEFLWGGCSR